jgi:hypothetical protein
VGYENKRIKEMDKSLRRESTYTFALPLANLILSWS